MRSWETYKNWLGDEWQHETSIDEQALPAPEPGQLQTDTRDMQAGQWFVPLVGETFDGHQFIEKAIEEGATGFFYQEGSAFSKNIPAKLSARGIRIRDSLKVLQRAATGWRRELANVKLAALTGSTGKTTTKEMLRQILSAAGPCLGTYASYNNEIGVPKTLLKMTSEHQYGVVEFGARKSGDIRFLVEMAEPDVCGVINAGKTHVGIFGSEEALLATKTEMFRHAKDQATLVSPAAACHEPLYEAAKKRQMPHLTFAWPLASLYESGQKLPEADVYIKKLKWHEDCTTDMTIHACGESCDLSIPIAHAALGQNVAAATALAIAAGAPLSATQEGLKSFNGVAGRFQIHRTEDLVIIDDTYNASPDSMFSGISTLKRLFPKKKISLVLGDMLELGDASQKEHEDIGRRAASLDGLVRLTTVGESAQWIATAAVQDGVNLRQCTSFESVDHLLASHLPKVLGRDYGAQVLYVKGSKDIKLGLLIQHLLNDIS